MSPASPSSAGVTYTAGIIREAWLRAQPNLQAPAAFTVSDGTTNIGVLGFDFQFFEHTVQPRETRDEQPFLPVDSGNFIVR